MRPSTERRALPLDLNVARGLFIGPQEDMLPKGVVTEMLNYRPLTTLNERILPPRLFTDGILDEAAHPRAILALVSFEDFTGQGYVFGFTERRVFNLNLGNRTWPAPYTAGDLTSNYNNAAWTLQTVAGTVNATLDGVGSDWNGQAGTNLWPIKVGDLIEDPSAPGTYREIASVAAGPPPTAITVTTNWAAPNYGPGPFGGVYRLFTCLPSDTFTHCFFNQAGVARLVVTNGGGQGANSEPGQRAYDPPLYWEAGMASFQPLPGLNALRGSANTGGVTAEICISYKDMLLLLNLRERTLPGAGVWVNMPQRIRNSDIGSCEIWNAPTGVEYANFVERTNTPGAIEAAANWRDMVLIGKRDQTELMMFTGGTNPVFVFENLLFNEGTQYRHGFAALREDLIMIGNRDIYRLAEAMPYKIGSEITEDFFSNIDEAGNRQVYAVRNKRKNEIWFFIKRKGFGSVYQGNDIAYIWNYDHNTWTKVEVSGMYPAIAGITAVCLVPYLQGGLSWDSLSDVTWDDLAGTTWDQLVSEVMETPLLGSENGRLVNWEGGDVILINSAPAITLDLWRDREGLLRTGLIDMGQPDYYKRLLGVDVEFEQCMSGYEKRVLYSDRKTSIAQMEHDTGWQPSDYFFDITAKFFVVMVRQTAREEALASEMAQIRLRYYLRGNR